MNIVEKSSSNSGRFSSFLSAFVIMAAISSVAFGNPAATRTGKVADEMFPAVHGLETSVFAPFSVLVVNTTNDSSDLVPGDGFCDNGGGFCSLRAAIQEANALPGANNIDFNIPGGCFQAIEPNSPLPDITETVTINGFSQPGALPNTAATGSNANMCIVLDGGPLGGFNDGLRIYAVNTVIRGMVISSWTDAGIEVVTGNGSVIEGNFIGTSYLGTSASPNRIGITVYANNVTVGGSTLLSRNIICGNLRNGVALVEPGSGNMVRNNQIGLSSTSSVLGNVEAGINIFRSSGNTIGGTSTTMRNVISGNGFGAIGGIDGSGITMLGDIVGRAPNNVIIGNYIGTDPFGTSARPNAHNGVRVFGAQNTTIGGTTAAERNVISGNTFDGILVYGTEATGNVIRGNTIGLDYQRLADLGNGRDGVSFFDAPNNRVGGVAAGEGNYIGGNTREGVRIEAAGADNNVIQGNVMGMSVTQAPMPQNGNIIGISGDGTIVGGTTAAARNYLGGSTFGVAFASNSGATVQGNWVGLGPSGSAVPNAAGIFLQDSSTNTVGGTAAGAGNVVSGNTFGIRLIGNSLTNVIQGNLVGTDTTGMNAIPNTVQGVLVQNGGGNTIGGTAPGARNVISGNGQQGLSLQNDSANNTVLGNYIGTKIDGLTALPNPVGVSISGLGSTGNVIGGTAANAGNVISGNTQSGVQIITQALNNRVEGNIIGLKADSSATLSNQTGIALFDRAQNNVVGGTAAGAGNVISGNTLSGVFLNDGASNNRIEGNKIGTDPTGTLDRGNLGQGVLIQQGSNFGINTINNTVGGTTPAARNLISGNDSGGVRITGTTTNGNIVAGNYIGSTDDGTDYLANNVYGVRVESPVNTIGGPTSASRNLISGQVATTDNGIVISNTGTGTIVRNNYIGTNAAGDYYLFNGIGITCSASSFIIDSNLISGSFYGVIVGNSNSGFIFNNRMGTNAAGTAYLGNGYGIYLTGSSNIRIGEDTGGSAAPNIIAGGTRTGISMVSSGSGNIIRQNSIFDNAGIGIDINDDGPTQNDYGDTDLVNNQQNFPVINSVTTTINGTINSTGFRSIRIEFYNSTTGDPSGYGEGKTFITSTVVGTDANGDATFSVANPIPIGGFISATATDLTTNDTSEFSAIKQVLAPTAVRYNGGKATQYPGRGNLVEWQTGLETDNLGFNVYREANGKRQLVTPNLVAGSALMTTASLLSEQNYTWFDAAAPADATYSIESVDLNGERDASPGFAAVASSGRMPESVNSPTFREVNSSIDGVTRDVEPIAKAMTHPRTEQVAVQNALGRLAGAKVLVRNAGYYRVSGADLLANGLQPGSDPRFLRMYADGVEQPIVVNGAEDGRFDPTDSIEFYGVGIDTSEAAERAYYVASSTELGKRMIFSDIAGQPSNSTTFMSTVERKDRSVYVSNLLNGEDENFFGAIVNSAGVDQTIDLTDLASGGTAEVFVTLQGITRDVHHVQVELNGRSLMTVDFTQMMKGEGRVTVPSSELVNGSNTIGLRAFGGGPDVSVIDRIQVRYPRLLKAVGGSLNFNAKGGQSVTVGGFRAKGTRMFDITDAANPVELSVRSVREMNPGSDVRTFTGTATPGGNGPRSIIAVSDAVALASLMPNYASNINGTKGADLVIITPHDFADAMQPLVARRQAQGLKVAVIDIADIYDEYSFGAKSSRAVRQFLETANSSWRVKPRYVLFAGDASYDPRGYVSDADRLQTRLVDTLSMESASDEWFGDFNDDGVAEMAIGRLPASNVGQMNAMVAKIVAYDQQSPSTSAAFVADISDGFDFANVNVAAKQVLPASMSTVDLVRDGNNDTTVHSDLLAAINSGQRLVSYSGHGSTGIWRGNIFTGADAASLTNAGRLPIFLTMTCLNGFSHHVSGESLSESLMKNPNGGAVAVWGSSGTTLPDSYEPITREIHASLLGGQTLGEAHLRAKRLVFNGEVRQTWTLFGDPSMRMR